MRKLLLVIVAFVLTFSLVGCQGPDIVNEGDTVIEYDGEPVYTQDEVDDMLSDLSLGVLLEDIKYLQLALDEVYTKDELDEGFEDVTLELQKLEEEILILEAIISIIIWETDPNYNYEDYREIAIERLKEKENE